MRALQVQMSAFGVGGFSCYRFFAIYCINLLSINDYVWVIIQYLVELDWIWVYVELGKGVGLFSIHCLHLLRRVVCLGSFVVIFLELRISRLS